LPQKGTIRGRKSYAATLNKDLTKGRKGTKKKRKNLLPKVNFRGKPQPNGNTCSFKQIPSFEKEEEKQKSTKAWGRGGGGGERALAAPQSRAKGLSARLQQEERLKKKKGVGGEGEELVVGAVESKKRRSKFFENALRRGEKKLKGG